MNILFLMTDQHRADHVSFLPGSRMGTPNFDRLAGSAGFSNCVTVNPICTPARCALLTGRYTRQIGMLAMSGDLNPQIPTYPQALRRAGYHTAGVGKFHWWQGWPWRTPRGRGHDLAGSEELIRRYGFDEVWETAGKQLAVKNDCSYVEHLRGKGLLEKFRDFVQACGANTNDALTSQQDLHEWPLPEEDYIDVVTADRIISAIERSPRDRPFFVFGSFCSPHQPTDPPKRWLERIPEQDLEGMVPSAVALPEEALGRLRRVRRGYKAMIALLDDQVGRILKTLEDRGLAENTAIVFCSDHGEMLGDHGRVQKGTWHEASARVPCAINHPGFAGRRVIDSPVEITDLSATILDIAGLEPQAALGQAWPAFGAQVPCRSLMPLVRGEAERVRDFAWSECSGNWEMVRSDHHTYVRELQYDSPGAQREMLFDRRTDPHELHGEIAPGAVLDWHRARRDWVVDRHPPMQTRWAPSRDE